MSNRIKYTAYLIAVGVFTAAIIAYIKDQKRFNELLSNEVPEGSCYIIIDLDKNVPRNIADDLYDDLAHMSEGLDGQPSSVMRSSLFGGRRIRIIGDLSRDSRAEEIIIYVNNLLTERGLTDRSSGWYVEPSGAIKLSGNIGTKAEQIP